jgi:DNA-3-methyladenine glycosylase II
MVARGRRPVHKPGMSPGLSSGVPPGVPPGTPPGIARPRPAHAAALHLSGVCPRFAALIGRVGPPALKVERGRDLYQALVRAIAHQQLHGKAAEAILGRFVALFPGQPFPSPERVLGVPAEALRACGFSAAKLAAVQDICAKTVDGTVPERRRAARLSDEALIERLTTIRGVGRWTVEMLLIFTLGRPDVLPVDDFGVREGYRILFELDAQPKPRALAELGLPWAPHRSMATWYLYRAVEEARRQGPSSRA